MWAPKCSDHAIHPTGMIFIGCQTKEVAVLLIEVWDAMGCNEHNDHLHYPLTELLNDGADGD